MKHIAQCILTLYSVDLDWEYPVAEDRSGRQVDFANFPKFMSRLKDSLSSGGKGISITLPASYWYLQHFDIVQLLKYVNWFNIMSYDLHGTWDKGNKWTGNFLNAHTNLTEIDQALDLLWRNDIPPDKVVLGMGFYGRSFSATSSSCTQPGCTFESGGESGRCSKETGILLNSEIDDLVQKNGVEPILYKEEAVKVATWGNQWVAYDDEETFKLKSEYAQGLCLGGLMVWAISHDTKDSKYNKALAKVANRKILALPATDGSDEPYSFEDIANPQCKWTNCGEGCPAGYVLMKREDSGKRGTEYMFDESGCGGGGRAHMFCCPAGDLPTCGWYTHNNGACDNKCPSGTVEVGSNDKYCRKKYQAACCTTNKKSMKLYTTCEWGEYPMCNNQAGCPGTDSAKNKLLASSPSGSGGASCNMLAFNPYDDDSWEVQSQKYCCDTSDTKASWGDCQWYDSLGLMPSGAPDKFCASGCPADRVRVAMDGLSKECYVGGAGGARSRCCLPNYSDTIEVENPKLDEYRSTLTAYLAAPQCPNPGPIFDTRRRLLKRTLRDGHSLDNYGNSNETNLESPADLSSRSDQSTINSAEAMLLVLLTSGTTSSMLEAMTTIWNDEVAGRFSGLRMPALRSYVTGLTEWLTEGPIQIAHGIICNPHFWSAYAGGSKTITCASNVCSVEKCEPDDIEEDEDDSLVLRETSLVEASAGTLKLPRAGVLEKRTRTYRAVLNDGTTSTAIILTLPDVSCPVVILD